MTKNLSQTRNRRSSDDVVQSWSGPVGKSENSSQAPSKRFTVEEAAAYIHPTFKPSAIRKAIHSGKLVATTFGGRRFYIEEEDLIDFIDREKRDNSVTPKREVVEHKSLGQNILSDYLKLEKHSVASSAPARKN